MRSLINLIHCTRTTINIYNHCLLSIEKISKMM